MEADTALHSHALRDRVRGAALRVARLSGTKAAEEAQLAAAIADVAAAKGRIALGPNVTSIFDGLQNLAHARSVGSLEVLLTAILQDVLPTEGSVKLVPTIKANATHLDVLLDKAGHLEDILDGNGGAVTNVVSAGLRFAALSRVKKNRRLMVLDEPDCWLKAERVSAFAQTLAQVSNQGKFQTFLITHKDPKYFEGNFNLVRFAADDEGNVTATALSPQVSSWTSDDEPGIRSIELFNVRRHKHTVVPCFPGGTAFIGDNNLGKSTAIMSSLKAVGYGESDDSIIRHDCDEARVIFHIEKNQRIEWSRNKTRSPVVLYRHFVGDELVAEGRPPARNQAPDWITELLGVSRVDDLDIQVGNQKTPVFLLDDSATRRAQLLSVGKEASYLPTLMKAYEARRAADRLVVKQGESSVSRLKLRGAYFGRVPALATSSEILTESADTLISDLEIREKLEATIVNLEARSARVEQLKRTVGALSGLGEPPVLQDTVELGRMVARLDRLDRVTKVRAVPTAPETPELAEVSNMAQLIKKLERLTRIASIPPLPPVPEIPTLAPLEKLTELGSRIRRAQKAVDAGQHLPTSFPEVPVLLDVSALDAQLSMQARRAAAVSAATTEANAAEDALAQCVAEMNKLIDELGQACPLCNGVLPHEHAPASRQQKDSHVH